MRKLTDTENTAAEKILAELLKTVEFKSLSKNLLSEILKSWAGQKTIKRKIAGLINRGVEKTIDSKDPGAKERRLDALLKSPEFLEEARRLTPSLIKGVGDWTLVYLKRLESLPTDVQAKFVKDALEAALSDKAGQSFASLVSVIKSSLTSDEEPFSGQILSFFSNWLKNVDFGELKESLELSVEEIEKIIQGANELIWRYPAKLVIMLSLIPFALNLGMKGTREIIAGFKQAPPDLVADIIASLLKDVDSGSAMDLANESFELVRKLMTGSALIGDPGTPRLASDIATMLNKIGDGLNEEVLYKSKLALLREKEEINKQTLSSLYEKPDRLERKFSFEAARINLKLQSLNHKLSLLENLPDEEFEAAAKSFLSDFDAREVSELTDQTLRLMERTAEFQPDLIPRLIEQSTRQLDLFQLRDLIFSASEGSAEGLGQLGRAVMPKLVVGICKVLSPADDEFEEDAREARNALRTLLASEEETS